LDIQCGCGHLGPDESLRREITKDAWQHLEAAAELCGVEKDAMPRKWPTSGSVCERCFDAHATAQEAELTKASQVKREKKEPGMEPLISRKPPRDMQHDGKTLPSSANPLYVMSTSWLDQWRSECMYAALAYGLCGWIDDLMPRRLPRSQSRRARASRADQLL
jgi:hypothetical protein